MNSPRRAAFSWVAVILLVLLAVLWAYRYDQGDRLVGNVTLDAERSVRVIERALGDFPCGRMGHECAYTAEYWENGDLRAKASFESDNFRATDVKIVADASHVVVILDGSTVFELTRGTWEVNGGR